MAGRAVVGKAVRVMDVRADAAVGQLVEPAVAMSQPEAVEYFDVPDVDPEAGDVWWVGVEKLRHLVRVREFAEVVAVLEADRDPVGGGVLRQLSQRAARLREEVECTIAPALDGRRAQGVDFFAVGGAACSPEQVAQSLQFPVMLTLLIPYMTTFFFVKHPDSTPALIASFIPLFAPMIMFMRISVLTPPFWQIALSMLIMLAAIYVMFRVAGKVFRIGSLMYGKRPSIREILRWALRPEGVTPPSRD